MIRYFHPSDDEQLAGQWQDSHFDEDGSWWVSVQRAGATLALAAGLALAATNTLAAQSVFSQAQDDPSLQPTPLVYEEYWQNPVAPWNWPQTTVFTDDDVHPTFVAAFTPDDGDQWHQLVAPVQATNYVSLPFLDPDLSPQEVAAALTAEDVIPWTPQLPPYDAPWTLLFFLDDGSTVPIFQPDEDFWVNPVPPWVWPQPQQPFAASDEDTQVIQFVAAEEPVWQSLVQPVPATLLWPQQWQFEQNEEAANLQAFTDEIFWQQLVRPVPASLIWPQQWAFEQTDATGALVLDLDEGLWRNPVPPVPATNLLLQQWPFEQYEPAGSFSTIHEEDFWNNAVRPVVWPQPSVFISDEVLLFAPNTGQDEDYWNYFFTPNVPPVPATMLLRYPYQPDPEEIPAGSLVPFIPPPPPFCPLPPPGPDPDISISTFSNFKGGPILALFCRICGSKNPLVVRGDYAIWCQECCAFVSKQDTYMGTTQAPGQFKARF